MSKILNIFFALFITLVLTVSAFAGQTSTNVEVYAVANVLASPMALTVSVVNPGTSGGIDFGDIQGTIGDIRFQATNHASISYFPGSNPTWYLYVWMNNDNSSTNDAGLMNDDESPTNYAPLKVWCANYGPTGFGDGSSAPYDGSEEDTYLWGGYDLNDDGDKDDVLTSGSYSEASLGIDLNGDDDIIDTWNASATGSVPATHNVADTCTGPLSETGSGWNWIWDYNHAVNSATLTKRKLCSKVGSDDKSLPSPFNAYFGVDVSGMASGTYDTTLTFEMNITEE